MHPFPGNCASFRAPLDVYPPKHVQENYSHTSGWQQYLTSILDRLGAPGLARLRELQTLLDADASTFPQAAASSQLDRDIIDKVSRKRPR